MMRTLNGLPSALLALCALLSACDTRGDLYSGAYKALPLVATSDSVVAIEAASRQAVLLPQRVALPLSEGARAAFVSPDRTRVAVLCGDKDAPRLDLIEPAARSVRSFAIPSLYDRATLDATGRYVVLSYSDKAAAGPRNVNEVGLLELSTGEASRIALPMESLAPLEVLFAHGRSEEHQWVAVLFDKGVALLDARAPSTPARRLSVRPRGSLSEATVLEAAFSHDDRFLFVRMSGSDELIAMELAESGAGLELSLNYLGSGTGLTAMLPVAAADGGAAVVALYGRDRTAALLAANGVEAQPTIVSMPEAFDKVAAMPDGTLVMYDPNMVALFAWNPKSGKSGTARLDAPHKRAFIGEELIFIHAEALSILRVEEEESALRLRNHPIQFPGGVTDALVMGRSLWTTSRYDDTLVVIELSALSIAQLQLPGRPGPLLALPTAGLVAVEHDAWRGDVSLVRAEPLELLMRVEGARYLGLANLGEGR